jgi:hypothetical protein
MNTERTFRTRRALPHRATVRKGSYSGRYEVEFDGEHVGWVIKESEYADLPGTWSAWIVSPYNEFRGVPAEHGCGTRVDAVLAVIFKSYQHGRIAEADYRAAVDESWYEDEEAVR